MTVIHSHTWPNNFSRRLQPNRDIYLLTSMADALVPWLLDYIRSVSETYGANISNVQSHTKGRKVQITEFLTYGSEEEDSLLWAQISDKQYIIPVKFMKSAVAQYARQNGTSKRFTQHKTAVITIKNFRLIFSRVPLGALGMTTQPSLAIECLWFSILGSSGEAMFGNPKPITDHPDMHLWSEYLKRDGGAGNILKDRKIRQQLNGLAGAIHSPTELPERPRSPISKRNIYQPMLCVPVNSAMVSYLNKWQFIERTHGYRRSFAAPPNQFVRTFLNVPAAEADLENGGVRDARKCPLSEWGLPPKVPLTEPNSSDNASSSSIPAPTPAQRMKTSNISERPMSDDLMAQQPVSRKIPRPTSPEPHGDMDPIRILAPNSDTSSQSQSISQTQSQLKRLPCDAQAGSTIDYEDSKALLFGIMIDLKGGKYPFLDLLRVREILERTNRLR